MSNVTVKSRLLARWKIIAAILVLIGIGSSIFYAGIANAWDEYKMMYGGETAPGYIIDVWEDVADVERGSVRWFHGGTYTYKLPDGREFTGKLEGAGRLKPNFRSLIQPYPVEVTYLPDNPAISRISADLPDSILELLRDQLYPYGFYSALFLFIGLYLLRVLIREEKHLPVAIQPHLM